MIEWVLNHIHPEAPYAESDENMNKTNSDWAAGACQVCPSCLISSKAQEESCVLNQKRVGRGSLGICRRFKVLGAVRSKGRSQLSAAILTQD